MNTRMKGKDLTFSFLETGYLVILGCLQTRYGG